MSQTSIFSDRDYLFISPLDYFSKRTMAEFQEDMKKGKEQNSEFIEEEYDSDTDTIPYDVERIPFEFGFVPISELPEVPLDIDEIDLYAIENSDDWDDLPNME